MADKLQLYQAALREVGNGEIASLSEDCESRRVLDSAYLRVVQFCLEAGLWNFAIRSVQIDSDPDVEPSFGFQFAFEKPNDWVRSAEFSGSENFGGGLNWYTDEVGVWLANTDPIFVRYVSNHTDFGLNLGKWPESFTRFVELTLADRIGKRQNQSDAMREMMRKELRVAKANALTKDAMNEAQPRYLPTGRLVSSRMGGARRDRVGRTLIG